MKFCRYCGRQELDDDVRYCERCGKSFSNETKEKTKKRDKSQQEVIDICEGFHLVLAPPGCGKTDILADRINQAIKSGVSPQDMLCLTFTNRASRGMLSRIKDTITTDTSEIFVGNVHRFCSLFLYENGFVPLNSSILDEFDVYSILLDLCSKDESTELDYSARKYYDEILNVQHYIYQLRNNHPKSVQKKISNKLEIICKHYGLSPIELFDKAEEINLGTFYSRELTEYLQVIKIAKRYDDYKNTFSVLDFDDLLLKTYTVISSPKSNHKRFKWIQVDEVQDLNPLQLAICDLLISEKDRSCIVYFGDEQQAIFSFLGASLEQLRILKERCGDNLHYLQNNYRSPSYLLNVFNEFANKELDTEPEFLPQPTKSENAQHNDLVIINSLDSYEEEENVVKISKKLLNVPIRHEKDQQRIAILVTKNEEADSIGDKFTSSGIPYFKLSGKDAFASPAVQTLFSHISVCCFENNIISWAKIFRQLKLFKGTNQYAKSRHFIKNMSECMMCPSDLIKYEDSSYLNEFSKAYLGEIVLFDTETTGLNIYEDDIVQIAALKIRNGIITDSFSIILETNKEIPLYLGKIQNPLVEEYNNESTHKYKRAEGLKLFLSFIGENNILVAHNANFDYHILDNNLKRDLLDGDFTKRYPTYFDTLKITKLVSPHLRSYKLKNLISAFNLDGHNSHLAQDDVEATKNLIDYCLKLFKPQQEKQEKFFVENRGVIDLFKAKYSKAWQHTQCRLFLKNQDTDKCLLTEELAWLYECFIGLELFKPCEKIEHIMRFLKSNVIDTVKELTLNEQISNHAIELGTYKEADLCESGVVKEKIFIATVHKAKGLEFENVFVMNAIENVYPFYNSTNIQEDARKFYVAISRAKIRLCLMTIDKRTVFSKKTGQFYDFDAEQSRFVDRIMEFFEYCRSDNTEDISNIYSVHKTDQNQVQASNTKQISNNRRSCSIWLNPAREFSRLIDPNTGAPRTMEVVMNNTDPNNVLEGHGLGIDYMMEAAEEMTPKYTPQQSDVIGRMKQRAIKTAKFITEDYNNAIANAPAGAKKVKVYDCCKEMTQEDLNNIYMDIDGKKVALNDFLTGNLVKSVKVTNPDGSKGVKYVPIKFYLKTAANLILETENPIADENKCTGENTGDEFDLPY